MAAVLSSVAVTLKPLNCSFSSSNSRLSHHPISAAVFPPSLRFNTFRRCKNITICFVIEDGRQSYPDILTTSRFEKVEWKKSERFTYLIAAMMSSLGITSMAIMSAYYRFYWQMKGGEVPVSEIFGTFAFSIGAVVGMEFWARWAHEALWHASLWNMHESHHKPREGAFELNDVFAIINAGLGITVFGIAYIFVHDGLVHKRFPVGPIANVPYFRKVAAAHQLHHTDKFKGVPYGLFLGPKEVEEVGGREELKKEISRRIKSYNKGSTS
ncbi:hypothetical protein HA466_0011040 [Hirschfeldia incana]|nr:hypothetical protein HA466_0011040 [Hirschfeldia incana]